MKEQKILEAFCKRLVALDMDIFGLRKQAQDEEKWITVHPGGKGMKSDGSGMKGGTPADKELIVIGKEARKGMKHTARKVAEKNVRNLMDELYKDQQSANKQKGAFDKQLEIAEDDELDPMFVNRLVHEGFISEEEATKKYGWKKPYDKLRKPSAQEKEMPDDAVF